MSDIQVLTRLPDWYANLARTATRVRLRFHPRTHYQGNEQAPRPGESRAFSVTGSPAIINRREGKTDNHELGRKDNTPTQRKNDRGTQQVRQQRERRPSPPAAGVGTCPPTGSWRPSTLRPRHPMRASPAGGWRLPLRLGRRHRLQTAAPRGAKETGQSADTVLEQLRNEATKRDRLICLETGAFQEVLDREVENSHRASPRKPAWRGGNDSNTATEKANIPAPGGLRNQQPHRSTGRHGANASGR